MKFSLVGVAAGMVVVYFSGALLPSHPASAGFAPSPIWGFARLGFPTSCQDPHHLSAGKP